MDDYAEQWRSICRYAKYIDDNARATSRPRYFCRRNEDMEQIADMSRDFIPVENPDENHLRRLDVPELNGMTFTFMQFLIESMKQDSGQNQFTRGEGGLGVTAASAIQALQEAGGKTARMHTASYKETFRRMIDQMIWVISDYVDAERIMMVTGLDDYGDETRSLRQVMLRPVQSRKDGRIPKPAYNVRIQVQKKNPMQIQANNQYVLQIAETCAQAGKPMPPAAILRLLQGIENKGAILREVEASDQTQAQLERMAAQIEQLTEQLKSMQKQSEMQRRVITQQHQAIAEQRAPAQTNAVNYDMLDTTNGVNRAEL